MSHMEFLKVGSIFLVSLPFGDHGTIWIEGKEGKRRERTPMERKGKESRGKWLSSILFGSSMEGKGNTEFLFGLKKENKGKERKRSSVNLLEKIEKNDLLKKFKLFKLIWFHFPPFPPTFGQKP